MIIMAMLETSDDDDGDGQMKEDCWQTQLFVQRPHNEPSLE